MLHSVLHKTQKLKLLLLNQLNPTPAVAGLPKAIAIKEIAKLENFNRSYYTGFLGIASSSILELFVNLRCMELNPKTATLYAGAGITKDSIPELEWAETRKKMMSIEKYL